MRLTLRTLLAWLDDVLPDQDREALGEKVAASPVAPRLIEKIRRVVAQPALSAPVPAGKGLADDANSVAEYLDNTLPSDQLEAFERICIESDLHLAEVAACHGLLADAARNPNVAAPLDEAGRQRLLGAMNHRSAVGAAATQRRENRELARMMRSEYENPADAVLASTLPPGELPAAAVNGRPRAVATNGRKSSPMAWIMAAVALTLLVALGGLLVRSINIANKGRRVAVAQPQPPVVDGASAAAAPVRAPVPIPIADVRAAPPADDAVADAGPAADANADADVNAAANTAAPGNQIVADPVDDGVTDGPAGQPADPQPAPPAAAPATAAAMPIPNSPAAAPAAGAAVAPPSDLATAQRVPQGDALAIAAPPPVAAAPAAAPAMTAIPAAPPAGDPAASNPAAGDAAADAADPAADAFAVGSVGANGLLLHRSDAGNAKEWASFPAGSPLAATEELLAPPGFHPDIEVGGVTIRFLPATRATLTLDDDGTPRIEVVFGRIVARSAQADARLGVTVGRMAGTVTAGLSGGVAVSADLERPRGADPAAEASRVHARIFAVSGGIQWAQAGGDDPAALLEGIPAKGMLEAGNAIEWDSLDPDVLSVVPHEGLPDWVVSAPRIAWVEKGASEALAAKVAATAPLTKALRELSATSRREENRMAAVATLALLGEFDELVELLCDDAPNRRLKNGQWTMLEAETVPLALARGANAAAKLRKAFEDHGPHGKAEALVAMARGFTDADLAAGGADALVEALDDPDLVVRRYAFKCLCDITQPSATDRLRYRPDTLPDPRREGVSWWRGQLEKGLVRRGASGAAAERPGSP